MPINARVYWKGYLRLSLVTIKVEIYSSVDSSSDFSFRQIHKPTGKRVKYEKMVPGHGPVENSDIVKGYEIDDDVYVLIEPEEIKALHLESQKALDLVQFVDADEIDPRYFERPYYVTPADEPSTEGYMVIRDALAKARKVGIGQVTMRGREHLVAISPVENGIVLNMLRYGAELRPASAFFDELPDTKLDKEMVTLATELIERKTAKFDPAAFKDNYAVALRNLVEEKSKGHKVVATGDEDAAPSAQVIDLMEALKKSVSSKAKAKEAAKAKSTKAAASKKSTKKKA